jgi:sialate O-acetylesterase
MRKRFWLASVFTDNMIFQANKTIRIFGECKKGIDLYIEFLDQSQKIKTKSDSFLFELLPEDYQEKSFSFKIYSKKQEEVFYNCQIGEVFLVTGGQNINLSLDDTFYSEEGNLNADVRFFELNEEYIEKSVYEEENLWKQYGKNDLHNQSAFSYIFARTLFESSKIPIGVITCRNKESTIFSWMSKSDLDSNKEITRLLESNTQKNNPIDFKPAYIYDKYIKNIMPFGLSGIIFYQGETDFLIHNLYETAFQQIIKCYRLGFKDHNLPIILTQIAGYNYPQSDDLSISSLRLAQTELMNDANKTYTVSAVDLGEEDNLTPKNKTIIARRLAAVVMDKVFKKGKNSLSPTYYSYQKQNGVIVLNTHNNYMNLISRSKKNMGFTYSEDGVNFKDVTDIELRGSQIVLRNIGKAVELRYCFNKFPFCDIYTTNDLPLLPFRIKFN